MILSSLIGMHFDPKAVMKSIIYLNDVGEESGPFSVVPSTNRWRPKTDQYNS